VECRLAFGSHQLVYLLSHRQQLYLPPISLRLVEVDQAIFAHAGIDGEGSVAVIKGLAQDGLDDRLVDDVVTHEQDELVLADRLPRAEQGDAVLPLPARVADGADPEAAPAADIRQERL